MDSKYPHRVRRLSLQFNAPDQATAIGLRALLQDALPEVGNSIDSSLDQVLVDIDSDADDQWLHISKLAVDIQLKPEQLLDRETILQAIQSQIQTQCQQIGPLISSSNRQTPKLNEASASLQSPKAQPGELDITTLSPSQRAQQGLLEYIQSGTLPWYIPSDADLAEVWDQLLERDSQIELLLKQINSFEGTIRLLSLIPDSNQQIWYQRLAPKSAKPITVLVPELWQLANKQEILSYQQGLAVLAAVLSGSGESLFPLGSSNPGPANSLSPISQAQLHQVYQQLQLQPPVQKALLDALADWQLVDLDVLSKSTETVPKAFPETTESEIYRIDFAGLVLLHPYLPRLFKQLEWLTEDQKIRPEQLEQAAQALSYLATGSVSLPEYQLGGIKLLLNLDPESLLITGKRPLDTAVVQELDRVLNSLLSHWGALKSSSAQGVQQAFLQRQALLQHRQDHWQLTLERQGMDLLIDQLPFAITTVKLLWMEQPIQVSW